MAAESNHQLYVFDAPTGAWGVGPTAPYDGGWGASIEYVSSAAKLYQIDGRNPTEAPEGTSALESSPGTPGCSPPPVPDGMFGGTMTAERADSSGTSIEVRWDVTSCAASGYHLLFGPLSAVVSYSLDGGVCGLRMSGSHLWTAAPSDDLWFVVVGDDEGQTEGSWGTNSSGGQINGETPSGLCGMTLRSNSESCP